MIDPKMLRKALGQFATGVTVITAICPQTRTPIGCTANSFSSVSLDPPLILWSINRTSASAAAYLSAQQFAVNILSADQIEMSSRFASSGQDKFAGVDWHQGLGGVPILSGVSAVFECSLFATHEGGDHTIIIGAVERFTRHERPGLVFAYGRYGLVADHPMEQAKTVTSGPGATPHPYDDFLIPLLFRAYEALFSKFSRHLSEMGTNGAEMRILAVLSILPSASLDLLMRATYLGEQSARDALRVLVAAGMVGGDEQHGLTLTGVGRERLSQLIAMAEGFEREQFSATGTLDLQRLKMALLSMSSNVTA